VPERVTREQLVEVFGEDAVVRVPDEAIPSDVTHAFTRAFLAETGVPGASEVEFIEFDEGIGDGLTPLRDSILFTGAGWDLPAGFENAYYLGDANGAVPITIALDGASGAVYAISETEDEPYLMNSDIESLVFFAYTLERHRELFSDDYHEQHGGQVDGEDTYERAARIIEEEWRAHDPAPFAVPEGEIMKVWPNVLDDISSAALG